MGKLKKICGKMKIPNLKTNQVLYMIFYLLCIGLCLSQISKICEMYFSYKTTISMSYENISEISLPALSICVNKLFLLKPKYLTQLEINRTEKISGLNTKKVLQLLANMTIKEQFIAMFGKEYVFLNSCRIMTPKAFNGTERYIHCEDITPIKTSLNFYSMCFTLFSQTEGQSDDRYVARTGG